MSDQRGFDEVLAARRMCRDFQPTALDPELVDRVVAALWRAPAAGNTDALMAVVLVGDDTKRYWSTTLTEQRREAFPWPGLLDAPVLVVPYVRPAAYPERYAQPDKAHTGLGAGTGDWPVPYWWIDGGAAVMAVLLAAESAGLGASLFGQFDHEAALAEQLGVPAGWRALGTIALGLRRDGGRSTSRSALHGRPDPSARVHRGRVGSTGT